MCFVVQSLTCWKNLISPLPHPLLPPHDFPNENHLRDTGEEKKKAPRVLSSNERTRERERGRKGGRKGGGMDGADGSMNMHI